MFEMNTYSLALIIVLVLVIVYLLYNGRIQGLIDFDKGDFQNPDTVGIVNPSSGPIPSKYQTAAVDVSDRGYIILYESPNFKEQVFEIMREPGEKAVRYRSLLRRIVGSAEVKAPRGGRITLWNVRGGANNASLVTDFYESNVYTVPEYLLEADANLEKVLEVSDGQSIRTSDLPVIRSLFINAAL